MPDFRKRTVKPKRPKLTTEQVVVWVKNFYKLYGYYPGCRERREVPGQPLERWDLINNYLQTGVRGLPGGDSLPKIRNRLLGLDKSVKIVVIPQVAREVEPLRTAEVVSANQKQLIPRLSLMDRSILTRWLQGEKQREIGELYGMSQAGVSYRISRALKRLQFLEATEAVTPEKFSRTLKVAKLPKEDRLILKHLRTTTGQSETAAALGISAGKVRHVLYRNIEVFSKLAGRNQKAYLATLRQLELLRDNPAIMVDLKNTWA